MYLHIMYISCSIQLLPSSTTKRHVWHVYKEACETATKRVLGYSTFCRLWRNQVPCILVMKPMSDLYWFCQRNTNLLLRSANQSEEVKSAALKEAEEHLSVVRIERSYYKTICDRCKQSYTQYLTSNGLQAITSEPAEPCSRPIAAHYSFDMAQQVHYPCDPLQPGPMYFLTPRKCGIFGVCNEALPRQINFLIEEACDTGKGANNIISKLHYFFTKYSFGEEDVYLHADNCTGQNKNNAMIHYLAWRVMVGLHRNITLSFLVVGHTKFAPDWCFGLFKKKLRKTKVGTLSDIGKVVDESARVNIPQICGTEAQSLEQLHTSRPTITFTSHLENLDLFSSK